MTPPPTSWQTVTPEIFAGLFPTEGRSLFPSTLKALAGADTRFREATREEYDEYLLHYFSLLKREEIVRDTEQNYAAWLRGWTENLNETLAAGPSAITCKPKYFRGNKFLRWKKGLVVTPNPQLEYDLFVAARHQIFQYWLKDAASIHELGCGSCDTLWLLQELFPDKIFRGYDWVGPAIKIADVIGQQPERHVMGEMLNFLEPPARLPLGKNAAVITVHALEQIGDRFEPILQSLLASQPTRVVHYEPIIEYYDEGNTLDYLANWYSNKRRYLSGLVGALHRLRDEGRIEILEEHRPGLGGVLHEASLIVWRPFDSFVTLL